MKIPTVTESAEHSHTAGRISMGAALPWASRRVAIVVGISWMEAVLSTTNVTIWLEAAEGSGADLESSFIAAIPKGVAALPKSQEVCNHVHGDCLCRF